MNEWNIGGDKCKYLPVQKEGKEREPKSLNPKIKQINLPLKRVKEGDLIRVYANPKTYSPCTCEFVKNVLCRV